MSRILVGHVASLLTTVIICNSTHAGVVGFQESFSQGAANWRGSTSATALKWSTVGSSIYEVFVTSNFNLANTQSGGIAANIIRAAASAGSSAGAYQGNRAADGVTGVSLWFRHDLAESIALSNIGNMQIGFVVPASLVGQNINGNFDMRGFSIVPAPGALTLLTMSALLMRRRR